jgi:8-oxo-dGTP diphosphatase
VQDPAHDGTPVAAPDAGPRAAPFAPAATPAPSPAPSPLAPIRVAAVALIRDRRLLMVTARGRDVHYMPGGKIDPGETAAEAAVREAREEIGVELDPAGVTPLFTVATQAHGEPEGRLVQMQVFAGSTAQAPRASNEIDALHWVTSADSHRCPPAGAETLRLLVAAGLVD